MFGATKLTKNYDPDKYAGHFDAGHGIVFDLHSLFSILKSRGKNIIIFGVNDNSSVHTDIDTKRYLSSW